MPRYIEVSELENNINKYCDIPRYAHENVLQAIDETTSADVEKVVRCKDCKHRYSSEFCECRDENAFCSEGEINA